MRLRWKFFFVLLGFSLVPMLVLTGFNRNHVEKLGRAIAAEGRVLMTDIIKNELKQTAEDYALVLRRSKSAMDFSLSVLAAETERVLFAPLPLQRGPGASPDSAPEAVGGIAASLLAGSPAVPAPQPFDRPAVFHPAGARPAPAKNARLAGLVPTFALLQSELGDLLLFAAVTLEDGAHVTYPGRADYPADYDPRQRPWYQAAKAAFDPARPGSGPVIWNDPGVDAATGRVTLTLSKALVGPGRRFVGVVSLDVPLARLLQEQEIASQWSESMRTFLVAPVRDPDTDVPSLYVWARRSATDTASDWKSAVNFDRLTSSDAAFSALVQAMERGRAGVAELPYNGEDAIWAFARLVNDATLLLVAPKAAILSPLADQTSQEILAATGEIVRLSGAAMAIVLLAVAVVALASTRAFIRPIVSTIEAWKQLGNGDFSVRLDLHVSDERQSLIDAFNETVPILADHVRLQRSMELAQEVQRSLLPAAPPDVPGLDVAGISLPCDETGGDYFEYRAVPREGETCLDAAVGDVTGHGVPSALLMATARALLLATEDNETPAQRVRRANRLLARDVGDTGRFMTLLAVEIRPRAGQARYVRAGHDPAILYDPAADAFIEWPGSGVPLGVIPEYPYKENLMPFDQPGLVLALGTDGIWEARNPAGDMYGKERFREVLRHSAGRPAAAIVAAAIADLDNFRANRRQEDDVTLVIIKHE